ncbi:MAG: hypothetical protein NTV68_03395 [Methanomicrobiales archaeon]|nr:hypothetical protein [Methanomicrobiales archaeon]
MAHDLLFVQKFVDWDRILIKSSPEATPCIDGRLWYSERIAEEYSGEILARVDINGRWWSTI